MGESSLIHITVPVSEVEAVALSGGADSMSIMSFLLEGRKKFRAVYFNHGTVHGEEAAIFVRKMCATAGIELIEGVIASTVKPKALSQEEYWRNERYAFLDSLDLKIATGHHLNDAAETYLMGVLHGRPRLIPPRRGKVMRPFLTTEKSRLVKWCTDRKVPFLLDPSNEDTKHPRNKIRRDIMPGILEVNPGFLGFIRRLYGQHYDKTGRKQDPSCHGENGGGDLFLTKAEPVLARGE